MFLYKPPSFFKKELIENEFIEKELNYKKTYHKRNFSKTDFLKKDGYSHEIQSRLHLLFIVPRPLPMSVINR